MSTSTATLNLRIQVQGASAQRELGQTRNAIGAIGGASRSAGGDMASLGNQIQAAKMQLLGLAGAATGVSAGLSIIEMADEYKNLDAKLHLVTKSQQEFADVQGKLTAMADANRQSLSATINLYSGIAPSLQKAGQSQTNILKAVDSVNKALVVGGATAQGSAASILQLTQALGSGVLRGDEFNSIMENGRGIAMMLADALHTDTGKLRGLAEQGKLTAEIVTAALIEQNDAVTEKFAKMPVTVGQAVQVVKNNLLTYVGGADSASGATSALSSALISLSGNLSTVANIGGAIAVVYAGRMLAGLTASVGANLAASAAIRARGAAELATAAQTAQASAVAADAKAIHTAMLLREAEAATASASGMARLRVVQMTLIPAQQAAAVAAAEAAAALAAQTAAATAQARASGIAATAMRGLSAAMAMVGGPIGLAVIAIAGLAYGLNHLVAEEEKSKDAIQDSSGAWLKYADITDKAKQLNLEYTTASKSKKQAIEAELKALNATTEAEIKSAAATLGATQAKLATLKISNQQQDYTASYVDDQGNLVADSNDANKTLENAYQRDIDQQIAKLQELNAGLQGVAHEQANLGKATDDTSTKTGQSAVEMLAAGKASKEAAKALHDHGDALKSVIESLQKQRIELEHGKLAAEYYTDRINGLTDAEARAKAGATQYNSLLEERKRLQQEAAGLSGSLIDKYKAHLEDIGLDSGAMAGIDAAKAATDRAVAASDKYKASIDATTAALKQQAEAATAAGASATGSFTAQASASGTASKTIMAGMQKQAEQHAAAIAAINRVAAATGTDATMMKTTAWIESRFNEKAHNASSASGIYQFVNGTAKRYGLSGNQFDPEANANAYVKLMRDNHSQLNTRGIATTGANLYLAHQQGVGGLSQIMAEASGKGQMSATVRRNMLNNRPENMQGSSASAFLTAWTEKYAQVEASVKATFGASVQVAQATTQAAAAAGKLDTTTQSVKDVTVEYGGAMDAARVSASDTTNLLQSSLNIEMGKLLQSAAQQTAQAKLTGAEYRQHELDVMKIGDARAAQIMQSEQLANYTAELTQLEADAASTRLGMAAQYTDELKKQNLSQEQIADLVSRKMQGATEKILHDIQQQTLQLSMSADQWRRLELSQDGYNNAQIASIVQAEKLLATTKLINEVSTKIGDGLLSALTSAADGGMAAFDGLKNTLKQSFADLVLTPTIKPLTDAVSRGIQGTLQGGTNPWASLQQQMSQTWNGLQQGGMQGYANAAGIGSVIGGLTGSQEGAIGGSLGSMAGKAIGTALGGPIGGAIGSVIGSAAGAALGDMFKDDDSARAKFTGGAPTDGFVNRAGNKLSATSTLGTFGFQEDGTHDLGDSGEKELAALVLRMAKIDDAVAKFMPVTEVQRVKQALAEYQHTGTDVETIVKDRLKIISTGLSAGLQSLIDFSGDADSVVSRLDELLTIQQQAIPALAKMNLQLGSTADAALLAATGLSDAAGGLSNLTNLASAYYDAVYSEDEQKQIALRTAQQAIDAYNTSSGAQLTSLASLRTYVEGLDLTTAAGRDASLAAMGLADELKLLAGSAVAGTSDLDSANAKLAEQQAIFKLFSDGLSAITSGLDDQLRTLEASYADQIRAYGEAQDAASGLRDALRSLQTGDLTTLVPVKQLEAARAEFERLQRAASGGDVDAAKKLESAGETLLRLSREYNASSADYSADFAAVSRGWESIAGILEDQQDPQQDMLAAQQRLIDQAASQAAQLAAVYGGILGGNTLLEMMGSDISKLPPAIATALNAILNDLKMPDTPTPTTLTVAEYKAKAFSETSKLTDPTAQIASLYPLLLNRAGDLAGINYWANELKNGVALKDVISRMVDAALDNGEWAKVHPNSHATGLYSVPYDNYSANLHAGEAVVDAASMTAMRKYGIPLQSKANGNNIVVNVDMQALVAKVEALTSEVRSLRSERAQDAQTAQQQRNSHIKQSGNTERGVIRAVKMRGGK